MRLALQVGLTHCLISRIVRWTAEPDDRGRRARGPRSPRLYARHTRCYSYAGNLGVGVISRPATPRKTRRQRLIMPSAILARALSGIDRIRIRPILPLSLFVILTGCSPGDPVAEMQVSVDGEKERYYSYPPPQIGSDRRPTCGWRGGREASVKPGKILEQYDAIHIGCGFDASDQIRNSSKYSLSLEFRRYDGEQFEAVLAVIRTSKDGLLLKSNLMDGKPPHWRCREKHCGIDFLELDLPDPQDESGILSFAFKLSAHMTYNLSEETVHIADFHLNGKITRHSPY